MMMTAARHDPGRKSVPLMGVGVAGLQAIATARRLGPVVTAPTAPHQGAGENRSAPNFSRSRTRNFKNAQTGRAATPKEMSKEYQPSRPR